MKVHITKKHILSILFISFICAFIPCNKVPDSKPDASAGDGGVPVAQEVEQPPAPQPTAATIEYSTSIVYYSQTDPQWANYLYGGSDPMSSYGCGPTVLAMLVSSLSDTVLTPPQAADYAASNGYWASGFGSRHGLIPEGASSYGLSVAVLNNKSAEGLKNALIYNKLVVLLVGPGEFTSTGHFIIACGVNADGTIRIADPSGPANSERSFPPEFLLSQLSSSTDASGPAWVISR